MNTYKIRKIAKLAAIGAAFTLFGTGIGYAAGEWENIWVQFDSVNLKVNGQNVTSSNLLYNDRTYVPLRACAEMLGSTVEWSQTSNTASITANTAGSADTAKVISDMKAAGVILKRIDRIHSLSDGLNTCYIDCIAYGNNIKSNVSNREDLATTAIEYFNQVITLYNQCLDYEDEIHKNMNLIGIDSSKVSKMFQCYSDCITNIKSAYNKFYDYESSKKLSDFEEAVKMHNDSFNAILEGDKIRRDYFTTTSDYIQNY